MLLQEHTSPSRIDLFRIAIPRYLILLPYVLDIVVFACAATALSSTNDGLILHYTFDVDEGGIVSDQSGSGHTGVIFGATWTSEGRIGSSCAFDGTNDFISVPDSSVLDTSIISAAAWVRLDDPVGNMMVMSKHSLFDNTSWLFNRRASGDFAFQAGNGTWPSLSITTPAEYMTGWRHVVAINIATQATIYVNGFVEAVGSGTVISTNNLSMYIGRNRDNGSGYFSGLVDDVRIYNRELTELEVQSLHILGSTTTTSTSSTSTTTSSTTSTSTTSSTSTTTPVGNGLVLYYDFDVDESGIVSDESGKGHTGTVFGVVEPAVGAIAGAFRFDGENDFINVPDSDLLDASIFSASVWIKPENACNSMVILSKYSISQNVGWHFGRNALQEIAFQGGNGMLPSRNVTTTETYNEGWYHVVVINMGTQAVLYVDGKFEADGGGMGISPNALSMNIGRDRFTGESFFDGLIDDVRFYNRELTYTEIQTLHAFGSTTSTTSTTTTSPAGFEQIVGFGHDNLFDRIVQTNRNNYLNPPFPYNEEHSGCSIMPSTGELLAILDCEDILVYDVDGTFKNHIPLIGFNDTEGICLYNAASNQFAIIEESLVDITIVTITSNTTSISKSSGRTIHTGLDVLPNTFFRGFEGVTYDAANDIFYVVKEDLPMAVYSVREEGTNVITKEVLCVERGIEGLATDLSDIFYDSLSGNLLILSDESSVLMECDLDGNVLDMLSVNLLQAEGVVLTEGGADLYVVGEPFYFERFSRVPKSSGGFEGSSPAFEVYLNVPSTNEVRVAFDVSSDDAIPEIDFSPSTGIVVFAAGSTSEFIIVDIFEDQLLEGNEELRVTLSSPVNAIVGRESTHVYEIKDEGYFSWEPIMSTQSFGVPFTVTITAKDTNNTTIGSFADCVMLSGVTSVEHQNIVIGENNAVGTLPIKTLYPELRQQVIYLDSEIGGSYVITGLALNVTSPPGSILNRWTIRMKHTSLSEFLNPTVWESNGWTCVHQSDVLISSTGWHTFPFDTAFTYDGTNNLMVDFSFFNSPPTFDGFCSSTLRNEFRGAFRVAFDSGDPLSLVGGVGRIMTIPDIMLLTDVELTPFIRPVFSSDFVNGEWTGKVSVSELISNSFLRATSETGHFGDSGPFSVVFAPSSNSQLISINTGNNDGFEDQSGAVWLNNSTVEFGHVVRGNWKDAAFRFSEVNVPQGKDVSAAFIQFTAAITESFDSSFMICGETTNNSEVLLSSNNNISSRLQTTTFVDWSPPPWTLDERGADQLTPNLADIVKEIIDRPDWVAGNPLTVFVKHDSGPLGRYVYAFDGDPAQAASLYVAWGDPLLDLTPPTVSSIDHATNSGLTIFWESRAENTYLVYRTTNLLLYWPGDVLTSGFAGDISGTNLFTDTNLFLPASFYTIEVDTPQ